MKFFDVHCHLFTRDILSRQGSVALNFLNRFLSDTKRNEEEQESFGQLNRLLGFIDTSLADSAEETFAQMRKVYGDNFAVCPLCMDLRYGMIDADGKTNVEETTNEDHAAGKSEETASYWSFRRIVNFFSGNRFSALPNMFNDSFLSQIEEMEKLKARYPEHVYPFFPVDPRRNRDCDLMVLIREKVGPGKPFVGIKLYPALGYSVTDPFLYGTENEKNGLFAYCEKYSIPVITHSGFSGYLTIEDIIPVMESLYPGFDKAFFKEQVKRFQLPKKKRLKDFSTGMKAKLKVLVAISHNAKLLILDEPTAGLDVVARDELLEMLREFMERDEERSILISSHISSDLETLCDDLYMIHEGKIILHEDTDVLLSDYGLLKVDRDQYAGLDKGYILRRKEESYGYSCLTDQKQYYLENYPGIAIEKGNIDEVITMMIRGERL